MLTSQGLSDHTIYAEVIFIKFPHTQKVGDSVPLLVPAGLLRHVARILDHCIYVEIGCQTVKQGKNQVQYGVR
jgi:hypothetical protein